MKLTSFKRYNFFLFNLKGRNRLNGSSLCCAIGLQVPRGMSNLFMSK